MKLYHKYYDDAIAEANRMMNNAQANISNTKVGAAVIAANESGKIGIFGGCNIEIAVGALNQHAEEIALYSAIKEGYLNILACVITSSSFLHRAAMCSRCLHPYTYINPDCEIIVLNPDNTEKLRVTVRERGGEWQYFGTSKLGVPVA